MSGDVTVTGGSVADVRSKLESGHPTAWLSIQPEYKDYGSRMTGGFFVRWREKGESFAKVVENEAALYKLLKPITKRYVDFCKKEAAVEAAKRKAELKSHVDAARRQLKAAEAHARKSKAL